MLRLAVWVLVLANAGYWAWAQGMLAPLGLTPAVQAEPQRLQNQIRPGSIRLLTPEDAKKIEEGGSAGRTNANGTTVAEVPPECLQAGIFNEEQTALLRPRLESALPAGSWQLESSAETARWIVYMGKYRNPETLEKKRNELRQLGLPFRAVTNDALAPGLALAGFAAQADAERELERMTGKGVRTAKVVMERAETRGQLLKLAAVDAGLRGKLEALTPQLDGKSFQPCR